MAGHQTQEVADLPDGHPRDVVPAGFCGTHATKYSLYCEDCDSAACSLCRTDGHETCRSFASLKDAAGEKRIVAKCLSASIRAKIGEGDLRLMEIKENSEDVEVKRTRVSQEIEDLWERVGKVLQEKKERMEKELEVLCVRKREELRFVHKETQFEVKKLNGILNHLLDGIADPNDNGFLTVFKDVKRIMDKLIRFAEFENFELQLVLNQEDMVQLDDLGIAYFSTCSTRTSSPIKRSGEAKPLKPDNSYCCNSDPDTQGLVFMGKSKDQSKEMRQSTDLLAESRNQEFTAVKSAQGIDSQHDNYPFQQQNFPKPGHTVENENKQTNAESKPVKEMRQSTDLLAESRNQEFTAVKSAQGINSQHDNYPFQQQNFPKPGHTVENENKQTNAESEPVLLKCIRVTRGYKIQLNVLHFDEFIFVTDRCKKLLKIYNIDGKLVELVNLDSQPLGLCLVKNKFITLALSDRQEIICYNWKYKCSLYKIIKTKEQYISVVTMKDNLICGCENSIDLIDFEDEAVLKSISTLTGLSDASSFCKPEFIVAKGDYLFLSDYLEGSLICFDLNGFVKFRYNGEGKDSLRNPMAICADDDFIYLADSKKIYCLTPEGTLKSLILSEKDGLNKPSCISASEGKLLVAELHQFNIKIFDISKRLSHFQSTAFSK